MATRLMPTLPIFVLAMGLALQTACNHLQTPRFMYPNEQEPVIPLSVTLVFDEPVRSATVEQIVCSNVQWKGRLGDAIVQSFSETGRARLAHLTIGEPSGTAQPVTAPPSAFTANITMASAAFMPTSRSGSDDTNYLAQFDVRLTATFHDTQGHRFPEAPMVYSNRVALWTPKIGGSDNQCATGQLDAAVRTAADHLANQLMGYLKQLQEKTQVDSTARRQNPDAGPSLMALKATLLDANNNLVLEGGEKIGVRIDVTNTGKAMLGATAVTLSGTPALIDAFTGALSRPVQIAALQPGETKSAILWGTLQTGLEASRGELTVTVTPSGTTNDTPATQTLLAAIFARGTSAAAASSSTIRPGPITIGDGQKLDRCAVIVGVSQYRTPWPGWQDGLAFDTKETVSLFSNSLHVPEARTLLLQDELAAQADIEEALTLWLPKLVTKDSIVYFYFAGHARADSKTGEVFLMPYDSTPQSSPFRLISLRFLQHRLLKLGAKLAVAVIEAPIDDTGATTKHSPRQHASPNWIGDLGGSSNSGTGTIVQISRRNSPSQSRQSLLKGLTGQADRDNDGTITLGEWLRSLRSIAITAPMLPPDLAVQSIPLSRINQP